MVGDAHHANVDQRPAVPGPNGDLIEKRSFFPRVDPLSPLVGQPSAVFGSVGIVALADSGLAQQFDGPLERDGTLPVQDLDEPPSQAVISTREEREPGLVSRILAAVAED
jgi:hypothetical protein